MADSMLAAEGTSSPASSPVKTPHKTPKKNFAKRTGGKPGSPTPNTPSPGGRKRRHQAETTKKKMEVLARIEAGESAAKLSKELGIPPQTISDWKKNRGKLLEQMQSGRQTNTKRERDSEHSQVFQGLTVWFNDRSSLPKPPVMSGEILIAAAEE